MRPHLVRWQWEGYPDFHRDRTNLLLHVVAVPWFVASSVGLVVSLCTAAWAAAGGAAVSMLVAFVLQGIGHKRERRAPIPFDGPGDAIARIFAEQFVTFPRFFLTGGFRAALAPDAPDAPDAHTRAPDVPATVDTPRGDGDNRGSHRSSP